MADRSKIEWTDATWNPVRARNRETGRVGWFCTHVTPGCEHCYAEGINRRLGTGINFKAQNIGEVEVFIDPDVLSKPLRWKRPRKIFVGSMTDLFGDFVPDAMIDRVFAVMALSPQHTFQLLTKRPERMRAYLQTARREKPIIEAQCRDHFRGVGFTLPLPNVWLGVSAEDQARADERIPTLLYTPAAKRFVSLEPLLGEIDLTGLRVELPGRPGWFPLNALAPLEAFGIPGLDQVITGGESGPKARPTHPDHFRRLRDDCASNGVAFFFKQWGWCLPGDMGGEDENGRPAWILEDETVGQIDYDTLGRGCLVQAHGCDFIRFHNKPTGRVLDGAVHDGMPEIRA